MKKFIAGLLFTGFLMAVCVASSHAQDAGSKILKFEKKVERKVDFVKSIEFAAILTDAISVEPSFTISCIDYNYVMPVADATLTPQARCRGPSQDINLM